MGDSMEELRENFDKWKTERMNVNFGKMKMLVSAMDEETSNSMWIVKIELWQTLYLCNL